MGIMLSSKTHLKKNPTDTDVTSRKELTDQTNYL